LESSPAQKVGREANNGLAFKKLCHLPPAS
jgi:hypothetical protein